MRRDEDTESSLPAWPEGRWPKVLHGVRILPRMPFVWFMRAYRMLISPLYGDVCRYYPSCSKYALDSFEVRGAVIGSAMTVWRLLRCNPLSSGGVDHVRGSVLEARSRTIWAAAGPTAPSAKAGGAPDNGRMDKR
ncbi:membrane protein insertion efficiency factor YidD [Brevibacterium album]|uniref:membrane protein insertion efficiency factor YidD n=1 Tax=Brevibacterium album TaxID=417948 RepID=UPI000429442D|nr:membrane protein insertion efficiency factor YidD [Brevibacterium album]